MNIDHADLLEASGKYDEEDEEKECLRPAPYVVTHQPKNVVTSGKSQGAAENA